MPLNASALQSSLASFFASPPDGGWVAATAATQCGQEWASAMTSYASAVIPASVAIPAAEEALAGALASAMALEEGASESAAVAAFAAWAATVGGGMAAAGYTGLPPAAPISLGALFAARHSDNGAAAAAAWSSTIDTWVRTATATLNAPPGTTIPWS